MLTVHAALTESRHLLKAAEISTYHLDSRILLEYSTGKSRETIAGHPEIELTIEETQLFFTLIKRRAAYEPIAHLIGKREFWGREFKVTHNTLDPRPDSETLIEQALKLFPDKNAPLRILDLGTGTGCLLLTLLKEYPFAKGIGVDIHFPALKVAQENTLNLGLEKRVQFILQCWAAGIKGCFDLIISNPPYITSADLALLQPEVSLYEPHIALEGGIDGLDCYRMIAPSLSPLLSDEGYAILEFGCGQETDISTILMTHQMQPILYSSDLGGIIRCVVANKIKEVKERSS